MATETAMPFDDDPIPTVLQFRRRNRFLADCVDADWGSSALQVTASGGSSVNIAGGRAIVQAALYELSSGPLNLSVSANGGGSNRTDYAVLTYDSSHDPGVYARVLAGAALTRNESGVWDFPLATWQKTPAGAITNFRDLRDFRGTYVRPTSSTARPLFPVPSEIRREMDSGKYIGFGGSTWAELMTLSDTGEVPLSISTATFEKDSFGANISRKVNGLVTWEISLLVKQNPPFSISQASIDANPGLLVATLPSGHWPKRLVCFSVTLSHNRHARLNFENDGQVRIQHIDGDLSSGMALRVANCFRP